MVFRRVASYIEGLVYIVVLISLASYSSFFLTIVPLRDWEIEKWKREKRRNSERRTISYFDLYIREEGFAKELKYSNHSIPGHIWNPSNQVPVFQTVNCIRLGRFVLSNKKFIDIKQSSFVPKLIFHYPIKGRPFKCPLNDWLLYVIMSQRYLKLSASFNTSNLVGIWITSLCTLNLLGKLFVCPPP